jgi:hypothetical protein
MGRNPLSRIVGRSLTRCLGCVKAQLWLTVLPTCGDAHISTNLNLSAAASRGRLFLLLPVFAFVLRCVPILFRLHLRTLRDNQFPRVVARARVARG